MKFRYYITDIPAGQVLGTNDESVARDFQASEDDFVVDALEGKWLNMEGDDDITDVSEG